MRSIALIAGVVGVSAVVKIGCIGGLAVRVGVVCGLTAGFSPMLPLQATALPPVYVRLPRQMATLQFSRVC